MKKMRNLIAVCMVFTLICIMFITGCSSNTPEQSSTQASVSASTQPVTSASAETTTPAPKKQYKMYLNFWMPGVEVCEEWHYSGVQAAKELGVTLDCNGAADGSVEKNCALIDQAIAQGYDAIITVVGSPDPLTVEFEKAQAAGIPVFTYHADAPDSPRIAFFGPDSKAYAEASAKYIADKVGKTGKIITVQSGTNDTENAIIGYFKDALAAYAPQCTIPVFISDTLDPAQAYAKITAAVEANKDVVGFFTSTMRGASDISKVCDEQGISPVIIGMDGVTSNLDLIKEGKVTGVVDQGSLMTAGQAVAAAVDYLDNGGKLTKFQPGVNGYPGILITQDNIADYQGAYEVFESIKSSS